MAAKAEIISATRALCPLPNQVDNFILFESAVEKMISRLFEKYRSNQNSIETVRNSLLEVGLVIEQEVKKNYTEGSLLARKLVIHGLW